MSNERIAGARPSASYGSVGTPSYESSTGYGTTGSRLAETGSQRGQGGIASEFEGTSRQISNLIFKINSNATSLERVAKSIGTLEDNAKLRSKVHVLQQDTNSIAANVARMLKDLASGNDRMRKLQVDRLSASFQEAVQRYSSIQKKTADKARAAMQETATGDSDFGSDAPRGRQARSDDDDRAALVEQRREELQAQALLVEDDLASAVERGDRMRQLEADILDVNSIFRDLAGMISSQGEMIDDIESNVTKAADNVVEGNVQLQQASKYQASARKKMCCLVAVAVVVVAIIAIVLAVELTKKK